MPLPITIWEYRHQYKRNFNKRGDGRKFEIMKKGEKIFVERTA